MRLNPFPLLALVFLSGSTLSVSGFSDPARTFPPDFTDTLRKYPVNSWPYFLQHLPIGPGPVLDYRGKPVRYQEKHVGIIAYDVGKTDLQQCADALMRLRAEYLFGQKRYNEIAFHFVSGDYYSWTDFCKGLRPVTKGSKVGFITGSSSERTHESLRKYLDIVYNYASTISLASELKPANDFEIGTVVIQAGSPGHCFIIIDKAITNTGQNVYKLAEGYTPAQSIYVLRNLNGGGVSCWYKLRKGIIETASYRFEKYTLGRFE